LWAINLEVNRRKGLFKVTLTPFISLTPFILTPFISLAVVGIKEADFIPGSLAPHSTTVTKGETSVTVVGSTSGVQLILNRAAGATSFQIQTCYPLSGATASTNWKAENYTDKTELGSG
jgi:hypothetical protein